jgi:biotin carboxylase
VERVLLIMATHTYRAKAFLQAARQLGIEVVVASERRQALAKQVRDTTLTLDFRRSDRAARQVADFAREHPLDAIVGVDDDTTVIAAKAASELGLPHNSIEAVRAARDKYQTRRRLAAADLPTPWFRRFSADADPRVVAARAPYPCVLKPVALAASRGVIRADDPEQFVEAFQRIARMLEADDSAGTRSSVPRHRILVESFIPGPEVALEGLLTNGRLNVLALFDKPDPLNGPYFEETIYVTPSRLPVSMQDQIAESTARAAAALGLHEGPLHAELRLGPGGPWVGEVAPRSIGGLCSNALRFGTGMSLEELILRHAIGADLVSLQRERSAAGVMMLPIPRAGTLREVRGREDAEAVPGVEELSITIALNRPVVPLPEGDRYLGFLFARAETPAEVEAALRKAHRRLGFVITTPGEPEDAVYLAAPARRLLPVVQTSR